MSVFELPLRQSDLKSLDMCLHRWTVLRDNPELDWETDAASIGSAVHTGIEGYLRGDVCDLDQMLDLVTMDFDARLDDPSFRFVKYATRETCIKWAHVYARHWFNKYSLHWPNPDNLLIEYTFKGVPLYQDENYNITMNGTIDLVDKIEMSDEHDEWHLLKPRDWKTSGRGEYIVWEYARWAVQPTAYTLALKHLFPWDHVADFSYSVMHAKGVQEFSVERGPADWAWLGQKALSYAKMIEAGVAPKKDDHALCSARWCPVWDRCKGASS